MTPLKELQASVAEIRHTVHTTSTTTNLAFWFPIYTLHFVLTKLDHDHKCTIPTVRHVGGSCKDTENLRLDTQRAVHP